MDIKLRFSGISMIVNIVYSLMFLFVAVLIFGLMAKAYFLISTIGGAIVLLIYSTLTSKSLKVPKHVTFTKDSIKLLYSKGWGIEDYEIVIPKNEAVVCSTINFSGYGITIKAKGQRYNMPFFRSRAYRLESGPESLWEHDKEQVNIGKDIYIRLADFKRAILLEVQKLGYQVEGI